MKQSIKLTNAVLVSLTCRPYHFKFKYPAGVFSYDARELIGVGVAGKRFNGLRKALFRLLVQLDLAIEEIQDDIWLDECAFPKRRPAAVRAKVSAVKKLKRPADVSAPEAPMSSDASVAPDDSSSEAK
jgi:hypothetical protein